MKGAKTELWVTVSVSTDNRRGNACPSIAPSAAVSLDLLEHWNGKDYCLLKLPEQNSCRFQSVAYLRIWNQKRDTRWGITHEWTYIPGMSVELHIWGIDSIAAFILKTLIFLYLTISLSLNLSLSLFFFDIKINVLNHF